MQSQEKFIKSLHPSVKYIDKIDGHDPNIYIALKKFDGKNTIVGTFIDCQDRIYKNISVYSVISRFERIGYGVQKHIAPQDLLYALEQIHKEELKIYKIRLNDKESLREKTMLIHFIEDIIVSPIYGNDKTFSEFSQQHFGSLFSILHFLYFQQDGGYDEYKWAIRDAWRSYQKNGSCDLLKGILKKNSEKIKSQFKNFQPWMK